MAQGKRQKVTSEQLRIRDCNWVWVELDSGETVRRFTTSDPWQLGHGDWVIKLEGMSGGFDLSRVTPIREVRVQLSLFGVDPQRRGMIP